MATKKEIVETLAAAGIPHDPTATVASLKALLHPEDQPMAEVIEEEKPEKVTAERRARWEAFLEKAAKDNVLFEQMKANGEFDKIPESFQ